MERVLTVDLGASALKAALWAGDGALLASAAVPTAFDEDAATGRSEADPAAWLAAFDAALAALGQTAGGLGPVAAVAVCGMTRTQVLVDAAGRAVGPALGLRDARAAGVAAAARARAEAAGADPSEAARLDAAHPAARLLWAESAWPEASARAAAVLEPKDWLTLALTGRAVSDPISMQRLSAAMEGGLAAAIGLTRDLRPERLAPAAIAGRVRAGLPGPRGALAGAAVTVGSHDAWAAVAGLGALEAGAGYVISGTTESAGLIALERAAAPGLLTVEWGPGLWQIGGPGLNGAAVADWAAEALGAVAPARAAPGAPPLLFLPFLRGERTPYWNPRLRGALIGLDAAHGPAEVARAVHLGLGFLNREVIGRAEAAAGLRATRVWLSGGGARGDWPALRAAALGREVAVPAVADAGLTGGLALALTALGRFADVTEAARAVSDPPLVVRPDPAEAARMDALFAAWQAAAAALEPLSDRLAEIG